MFFIETQVSDTSPLGILFVYLSRFEVNFNYSMEDGCNRAFHFNPRLENGKVVRNTYFDGSWLTEETYAPSMPFTSEIMFEIGFLVQADKYKVNYVYV